MKYYIKRELNEYGPYTLADLQRYLAQGNISLTDLTRSEGLTDWVPVSQAIGNIPIPVPGSVGVPSPGTAYGGTPAYGVAAAPAMTAGPTPPDFHWALVLLINFLCNWFGVIWLFVEAGFIRKIVPTSKGIVLLALTFAGMLGGVIILAVAGENRELIAPVVAGLGLLVLLGGIVLYFVAVFSMRSDLEDYYNSLENIHLRLTGVGSTLLTVFFAPFYFQWHFSRIAKWKKTGILDPQG
jgi:hypothetical protein